MKSSTFPSLKNEVKFALKKTPKEFHRAHVFLTDNQFNFLFFWAWCEETWRNIPKNFSIDSWHKLFVAEIKKVRVHVAMFLLQLCDLFLWWDNMDSQFLPRTTWEGEGRVTIETCEKNFFFTLSCVELLMKLWMTIQ